MSKQNHHRQGTHRRILVHSGAFHTGLRVHLVLDKPTGRLPDFHRPRLLALQHDVTAHAARLLRWDKGRRRRGFRKRLSTALFEHPLQCLIRREDGGRFILLTLVTELRRPVQSLELYGDVLRSVEVWQLWGRLMPCKEEGGHLFRIARQEVGQRAHRYRVGARGGLEWSALRQQSLRQQSFVNPVAILASRARCRGFPLACQPDGSMVRCDCFTRPTSNIQQAGARVGSEASLGLV